MHKLLSSALVATLLSTTAHALTINEVVGVVLTENPKLLQARYTTDIAKESMVQAKGSFLPTVTASGAMSNVDQKFTNDTKTETHPKSASINLEQTLFAGGGVISAYRSSRNAYDAAKANYDSSVQTNLKAAVDAYVNLLTSKGVYTLNENQVSLLAEQLKMTNARFKQGEVTKTDIKQSEARLANARAEFLKAKGDLAVAKSALENVIGKPLKSEDDITWFELGFNFNEVDFKTQKAQALELHPNVVSALASLSGKKYAVNSARSAHLPTVKAVASYGRTRGIDSSSNDERSIGLQVSLPIFAGGKTQSAVRSSISDRELSRQVYEQTKRDIEAELIAAWSLYNASVASLDSYNATKDAVIIAVEGVQKEQMLGERTVLDVLDARQELLQAEVNVTLGKGAVIKNAYRLKAALGELDASAF